MGRIIKRWAFGLVFLLNLFRICEGYPAAATREQYVSLCLTQDIKTWHPDTNFLNPRNWEKGQMPCANDRIIFPASTPIITMMPDSLSIRELILPFDGVLVFPENAEVNLTTGTGNEACPGKDVHFQATTDLWYDPINWNITSDRAFPRIPNRKNAAVPHALRVPCITDKVQFPEKTTFRSSVIYPVTKVASMVINSKSYSQSELDDLLRSHVGSLLFPGNPVIQVTNSPCTDESGCACGNDGPELEPTICNEVTPYCPKSLECSDPITPVGNCCPICGARIMIKHKESFRMDRLMALHRSFLDKGEYKDVESFTAKTFQGDIQSVFVDGAQYKGLANKVADKILNSLNSDLKDLSGDRYRIRSVEIYKSESWNSGVPTYESLTGGMSSGGLAALIIVMIVVFGLGAAFFIYKKRHISGFDFARFDLGADKIELELGTTPHDELQPVDPPESTRGKDEKNRSFDNPVYGTSVEEMPSAAGESAIEKGFVENPMFMVFEDSSGRSSKEDKKE